ncbi:helicase C-terminal domain-containing protein [Candidatus Viridilinea mediisalina]|uniref:3'-5' exonuclease DinG n=1 Tax=Candidatus Viridilinea mediisalina TaxID=2024553 RepID=A0A2A6RFS8_9CHLR|nr:helicase C-terminal domain-containing protein [Candidatus Viridilinea mediisalina]PDW01738.1 DNA polymerase III subunit epsilon [Candidatus Viridilinea mediisalina]
MNERIYVALDVETTGLTLGVDELIEVAAVKFRPGEILEQYSQLVRPRQALPLKITRITGITPADLEHAPTFNAIGSTFAQFVKSYPIVGHSVGFDLDMLRAQGMNFSQPVYDTFDLAMLLMPHAPVYKLGALAANLDIPHPDAHRALNDALVTAHVFSHLLAMIDQLSLDDLNEIVRLSSKIVTPMGDLFAAALRERAKHAFIVGPGGAAAQPKPSVEWVPLKPTNDQRPLDLGAVTTFFAPTGPLGQRFAGYEPREAQVEMARAVAQAFNHGEPLLVEAGTGTGKSLAYLTPAAMFAVRRGERVVVSTNTINLQDQLFFKDVPDLQRIMADAGEPAFSAALLKGRSNYLCLKRYHELRRNENLAPEEVRTLLKVQLWLPGTPSGDKAELLLLEREHNAWGRINVTPETCIGARCDYFRECFFFQARRQAEAAHVLIVNHALLISDLANQSKVLPAYDHLIIDEAHNLEEVATAQLSFELDQAMLNKFLDDLYQTGGVQLVAGILSELPTFLQSVPGEASEKLGQLCDELHPHVQRARVTGYECFNLLQAFVHDASSDNLYDPRIRITPELRTKHAAWPEIQTTWASLNDALAVIGHGLANIDSQLREQQKQGLEGCEELLLRVEFLARFASEVRIHTCHLFFGDEASICWITHERQRENIKLTVAPLSVAELLQPQLFAQKQTCILASATLTIEEGFEFMQSRLGLEHADELLLESPFDYEQQALVFIPSDIPEPNQRGYQQALEDALVELCTATGGRTLALFTANSSLKQTYTAIQEPLEEHEIAVLGQNIDGSRRAILDRFREFPRTVLLGTTSFWEGVDVVGDALSVLVITKLPFNVPTDPIFAARSEIFGRDAFELFAIPQSILRFKQGFGRLIRSREDRGIVVVLDKRLLSKKYGAQFLGSLPNTRVLKGTLRQLPQIAARFLGNK